MRIDFRITTGARAGQRDLFDKSVIAIGRHPLSDLRFDAHKDVDVSAKHAEVRVVGGVATLRDLNSTNGTFVNGERLAGERVLAEGDVITFGGHGPTAEFHLIAGAVATEPAEASATRLSSATPGSGSPGSGSSGSGSPGSAQAAVPARRDTTARIADAVHQQTSRLRKMMMGLGAVVVLGVGGAWWLVQRGAATQRAQIDTLLTRNDSLGRELERTVRAMGGKVAGLDSALGASKSESDRLRSRIRSAQQRGDGENVGELAARLDAAEGRQRAWVTAASVDYEAIAARNGPAIVFIASEQANGDVISGSGFNVLPSGLVVTNRHVVQDEQGRAAKRIALIFDNTKGRWMTARVMKVSATDELAFLRIEAGGGGLPVVAGVAKGTAPPVGAPVAIIGYPLGTSTVGMGGDITKIQPKSTLGVGTVSKAIADTLQFDAYAAEGSSGSAVFDARGMVVGVVFGGARESNGRIVYAVPASRLAAQMPAEAARIVK